MLLPHDGALLVNEGLLGDLARHQSLHQGSLTMKIFILLSCIQQTLLTDLLSLTVSDLLVQSLHLSHLVPQLGAHGLDDGLQVSDASSLRLVFSCVQ